jgi:hypothetical protein
MCNLRNHNFQTKPFTKLIHDSLEFKNIFFQTKFNYFKSKLQLRIKKKLFEGNGPIRITYYREYRFLSLFKLVNPKGLKALKKLKNFGYL